MIETVSLVLAYFFAGAFVWLPLALGCWCLVEFIRCRREFDPDRRGYLVGALAGFAGSVLMAIASFAYISWWEWAFLAGFFFMAISGLVMARKGDARIWRQFRGIP